MNTFRMLGRVKAVLARRPGTQLLLMEHRNVISIHWQPPMKLNTFLGGGLDVSKMAAAIDATLHRNRVRI